MTSPRFRQHKTFGKRSEMSEIAEPKKTYFIICEGKKTENQYFNGVFNYRKELKIHQLVDIVVKEQTGKNHIPHPVYLVDSCIEDINLGHFKDFDKDIDEIWIIFDRDPETFLEDQYKYVYERCKEYEINIGFTNPNFEFWLLLHLPQIENYDRSILLSNNKIAGRRSKRFIEKELSQRFENGYNKKNIEFKRFLPNINLAIEQEKLFKQDIDDIFNELGSNIGILVSKMRQS